MISCTTFRSEFLPGTDDHAVLEHLRACDACLDFATRTDPDVLFRALGGGELLPPGGVDAFVDEVMREVRLRSTETGITARRTGTWTRRLAVAATLAAAVTAGSLYVRMTGRATDIPVGLTAAVQRADIRPAVTLPVVDTYDSENATIVEVPSTDSNVKVVMVFDESLPADL